MERSIENMDSFFYLKVSFNESLGVFYATQEWPTLPRGFSSRPPLKTRLPGLPEIAVNCEACSAPEDFLTRNGVPLDVFRPGTRPIARQRDHVVLKFPWRKFPPHFSLFACNIRSQAYFRKPRRVFSFPDLFASVNTFGARRLLRYRRSPPFC